MSIPGAVVRALIAYRYRHTAKKKEPSLFSPFPPVESTETQWASSVSETSVPMLAIERIPFYLSTGYSSSSRISSTL